MSKPAGSRPPVAPRFLPGGSAAGPATDPYAWMRDRDLPAMRDYLAAERAYYDQQTEPARELWEELAGELTGRVPAAEESVSWRRGGCTYFTRTVPGREYEQFCRAVPGAPAEVLLDENLLLDDPACTAGYVSLGVREVSPDGRLLAYSADFDGDEVYQLRVRDLASGSDLAERIDGTYYELAWSAGSRSFYYTVTDAVYRPHEVWRHRLGTGPEHDVLVFREDDERFELTVRATRSGKYVLIESASLDSTETLVIPADDDRAPPAVMQKRRTGIEYRADHADGPDGGEFYLVTNDGAAEFRLVRAPAARARREGWTEVIAGSPDTRLVSCEVFGRYLVVEQRRGAATQLRIVDRHTGAQRLIEAGGPHVSLALAVNKDYGAAAVTVRTQSLIEPPAWHDVDLASGRWQLRKRQDVPGYDPAGYVTERIAAPAADGTLARSTSCQAGGSIRDCVRTVTASAP